MSDRDPRTTPGKPNSTRFVCPFDDWHYDDPDDHWPDPIPADVTTGAMTLAEMSAAIVTAQLLAKHKRIDGIIREHLESHTLEEWFAVAVKLQQIQQSATALTETRPPSPERLNEALCMGALAINDARWIRHAQALIEALRPSDCARLTLERRHIRRRCRRRDTRHVGHRRADVSRLRYARQDG